MAVEDAYELAYREAVRALEHQRAAAYELRSRAGMLLATASITLSLLGQDAFRGARPLAGLAVACFALLSGCVIAVVWPHPTWHMDVDPQAVLSARLATGEPLVAELTLELIALHGRHYRANGVLLARTARVFRIGACLLAIQIVLTVVAASAMV